MSNSPADILSVITHDLRNGLNAITMSAHMIGGGLPPDDQELRIDFQMLQESIENSRLMLDCIAEYVHVLDDQATRPAVAFEPAQLIQSVLSELNGSFPDEKQAHHGRIEVELSGPQRVELDPQRCRLALLHALKNALISAPEKTVTLRSQKDGDSWSLIIHDPSPAPLRISDEPLERVAPERILSTAKERRGLDLALVAALTASQGGTARLAPGADGGTELRLHWPMRSGSSLGILSE